MVKDFRWLWAELTRDDRETPDLDPKVIERGWIKGYGDVETRTDVRLLNQVIAAKRNTVVV